MAYRHRPGQQPPASRGLDGVSSARFNRTNPVWFDGPTEPPRKGAVASPADLVEYLSSDAASVLSSPLTEGTDDVRADEQCRVEETGSGIPGGGGSTDDHPRGGDPVGSDADVGRLEDPAEAVDRSAACGESDITEASDEQDALDT